MTDLYAGLVERLDSGAGSSVTRHCLATFSALLNHWTEKPWLGLRMASDPEEGSDALSSLLFDWSTPHKDDSLIGLADHALGHHDALVPKLHHTEAVLRNEAKHELSFGWSPACVVELRTVFANALGRGSHGVRSAVDEPRRVRGPTPFADEVIHDPERLADRHGVLVRVFVLLTVGEDVPVARSLRTGVHGMFAGVALTGEQHDHRAFGVRHEGQRPSGRTGQPCLQPASADPRPKCLRHRLGRHRKGTAAIDHP
jgi:hypothetical protein